MSICPSSPEPSSWCNSEPTGAHRLYVKIYIMTDIEGVAGVINMLDWCVPEGRYYETGKELLTREVNAAIEGFCAAGATELVVADGHGHGAIHPGLLDPRAEYMRGWPGGYPYLLDHTYDAVAWVGQHAMSRAEYAHLAHTGSFAKLEYLVNGVAVGEFGQLAMCAGELGVCSIFGSGDRAFCFEAQALVPGFETVEVKRGSTPGKGDECDAEAYANHNLAAIHLHPAQARARIAAGAKRALQRFALQRFGLLSVPPPYEMIKRFRSRGGRPPVKIRGTHAASAIALFNVLPNDPP